MNMELYPNKNLYIDNREPKSVIVRGKHILGDNPNIDEIKVKQLKEGDVCYKNIIFERKTVDDFAKSIFDKRIFRQARAMRENYPYRYIIQVGDERNLFGKIRYRHFTEDVYKRTVASLTVKYECPVIKVHDIIDFWEYVSNFIDKAEDDKPLYSIDRPTVRSMNPDENMLMAGIYGIGRSKAENICDIYSIHDLYHITEKDLMNIKGIGTKLAEKIKEIYK